MPEAAIVVLLFAFPLVGLLTRRWAALLLPAIGWPLFYAGLDRHWWGYGLGDGWELAAIVLTAAGVLTTAGAIALVRSLSGGHARRPDPA
jgi:hypothetical protein